MRFSLPRMLRAGSLIALCLFVFTGCEKGSDRPEDTLAPPGTNPTAAAPATHATSINLGSDVAGDLRKKADGGDVQAMMVLGRFYESRNSEADHTEAAKWYKKAADAGDTSAAEALRNLDRSASAASQPVTSGNGTAGASSSPSASFSLNLPDALNTGDTGYAPGTGAATGPTTGPATAAAVADNDPIDPTKTRWKDLIRIIDTKNFPTSIRSTDEFKFLGATASPDRSISLFAAGQSPDALEGVTAIIRVRNRLDPATSDRVAQMATIAAFVTRDNVSKQEMIQWVKAYLTTGKSTEPIQRNGWRIIVSGPAAEGVRDDHDYLGAAVLVEMKK